MDTLLSFITNLGVWVLALMGVGMSFNPPSKEDRRTQWIWFGAFAVVSLVAGGSGFWNGVRNQAAQEELEAKLTSANNYCYFQADLNRPQPKGGYEWQLINKKQARTQQGPAGFVVTSAVIAVELLSYCHGLAVALPWHCLATLLSIHACLPWHCPCHGMHACLVNSCKGCG